MGTHQMMIMRKDDRICGTPKTTFVMTGPGLLVMSRLDIVVTYIVH